MKFNILKSVFFEVMGYLKGIIPVNSALSMMQNFYVQAKDNNLIIVGTDQENTIKIDVKTDIIEGGEVALPYKFLYETIANIPSDSVLQFDLKDDFMEIKSDSNRFKVVFADANEYPQPPEFTERLKFTLETKVLSDMIKKTIFAVSSDKSTRVHMSGLNFKIMQNILHVAGTDSRRLAYIKKSVNCNEEFSFTVASETLKEVRNLCDKYESVDIILTEDENQIIFKFDSVIYYSRLLEEEFPDYLSIIPSDFQTRLNIASKDFKQILKMARPIAHASSVKSIRLRLEDKVLYFDADAEEQGKFNTSIPVSVEGENTDISFNIDYLYNGAEIASTENIILDLNGRTRPTVIREEDNNDFIYIVMPIRG